MNTGSNGTGRSALEYSCEIESYRGIDYVAVRLGKEGDLTGGESGNFKGLSKCIFEKIGTDNIENVLIDGSEFTGIIDSPAIGCLLELKRRKEVVMYSFNEIVVNAVERVIEVEFAASKDDALEYMIQKNPPEYR